MTADNAISYILDHKDEFNDIKYLHFLRPNCKPVIHFLRPNCKPNIHFLRPKSIRDLFVLHFA